MDHRLKITVCMRIMQGTMFAEALDEIRSLNVVLERFGRVAGGKQVAESIELDAPGVAAPFGKQLEAIPCADDSARCLAESRCRGYRP